MLNLTSKKEIESKQTLEFVLAVLPQLEALSLHLRAVPAGLGIQEDTRFINTAMALRVPTVNQG